MRFRLSGLIGSEVAPRQTVWWWLSSRAGRACDGSACMRVGARGGALVQEAERKQVLEVARRQHRAALDHADSLPEHPQGLDPAEEAALKERRGAAAEQLGNLSNERRNCAQQISLLDPDRSRAQKHLQRLSQVALRRLQARSAAPLFAPSLRLHGRLQLHLEYILRARHLGFGYVHA